MDKDENRRKQILPFCVVVALTLDNLTTKCIQDIFNLLSLDWLNMRKILW